MLDKFRKKVQERIEKNAVKIPNLTYRDSKGKEHTEDIVLKRSGIPLIGDWARIYPVEDENGKPLWANIFFGGKKNLIKLLAIMGILFLLYTMFTGLLGASKEYMDGRKYVIINRTLFDKYCSISLSEYQKGTSVILNESMIKEMIGGQG